jgi:hypothetical protein
VEWTQEIRLRRMQPTIRRFRFSNVPRGLLLSDSRTKRPDVNSRGKRCFPCEVRP